MNFYDDLEKVMDVYTKTGGFFTVKNENTVNTMTVSWGMIGFFWKKPCFFVGLRPQRFTKTLLDAGAQTFTISIPMGTMSEELKICGTKSGADLDKSTIVHFVPSQSIESPVVEGCHYYYECRLVYTGKFEKGTLPTEIEKSIYPNDDFHAVYIGEIVNCYKTNA